MRSIHHLTSLGLYKVQDCPMSQQGAGIGATDALSDTGCFSRESISPPVASVRVLLTIMKQQCIIQDARARAQIQWPALGLS